MPVQAAVLVLFLLFCQALGAGVGVFTAVWGELAYIRATRLAGDGKSRQVHDGNIDAAERAHLLIIGRGLRFGMMLLLLSSFALVVAAYVFGEALQPALTASYWTFVALAFLVIGISWALSRRRISFALGSAAALAAWGLLALLVLGQLPSFSFGSVIALYVVLAAVLYAVLHYVRLLVLHKK